MKNAERGRSGERRTAGDPGTICGAVLKKLHVLNFKLNEYLQQNAGRGGAYNEAQFVYTLGTNLQLIPEICNESQLQYLWS